MRLLLLFGAASAVTYLLRVAFVLFLSPDHLPAAVERALGFVGPAAMAALAAHAALRGARSGSGPAVQVVALAVAVLLARWKASAALTVGGAVAAGYLTGLVL